MAANGSMTTRQIFNLRWNNHTNNMLQVFLEQLADEKLVDITLSCEGEFLKVHKIVLSACSPYFQELFARHKEQNPIVILNGIKFADLKTVVNFMYCGEIEVAEAEMEGVLAVAEALQVKGLSNVRDNYVSQHKKPSGSEEEGDKPTGGLAKTKTHPSPWKKRKLAERNQWNSSAGSNVDGLKMNYEAEETNLPSTVSTEECEQDLLGDTVVKEEVPDADVDIPDKTEEATLWNLENEKAANTEKGPVFTTDHDVEDAPSQVTEMAGKNIYSARDVLSLPISNDQSLTPMEEPNAASLSEPLEIISLPVLSSGSSRCSTVAYSEERVHDKIPRPPNAFMVFANEWRRKLAELHHGETNKDISVRLGVMWKKLDPEAKESYFAAARRADAEHKLRYPGYIYSPKEARLRKILRRVTHRHGASRLPMNTQGSSSDASGLIEFPEHPLRAKSKH